jgi:hypothetical protein
VTASCAVGELLCRERVVAVGGGLLVGVRTGRRERRAPLGTTSCRVPSRVVSSSVAYDSVRSRGGPAERECLEKRHGGEIAQLVIAAP